MGLLLIHQDPSHAEGEVVLATDCVVIRDHCPAASPLDKHLPGLMGHHLA
mgnify:FL=1